ncbi:polysulfide reductase NrfD [Anaerobacillus sp. HL2]|nr:polysulfide reductase NrfD [Anaerobacillus sp. HL2]
MIHLLFTPNFSSAIFGWVYCMGVYLVLLCFEFFYMIKNDHKESTFFGLLVLISAIAAHSNLGAVFGFLTTRPYWNGPYMSIYFINILSGAALLSIMYFIVAKVKKDETLYYRGEHILSSLGKLLVLFIGITLFFTTWKILTGLYGAVPGKYRSIMTILTGPMSMQFWISEMGLGMVLPLLILSLPGGFSPKRVVTAATMAIVGIFFMRIDLVFAGQIIPLQPVGMEVRPIARFRFQSLNGQYFF